MTLRSITVKQPWVWAIMHGKPVENRTWTTNHRGPIAIHAGKGWDLDGEFSPLVRQAWREAGNRGDLVVDFPGAKGAVVAVAELVDVCRGPINRSGQLACDCSPWAAAGQYHWRLANVRPLVKPVTCKGALGLWTLPMDVEAAVAVQLEEQANA